MQADGDRLPLAVKDLGSCDLYPQSLQHNGNGRFVAVCGDGEYIVYTALAWRNKSFGSALDVVWGDDSSTYAIRCCPPACHCWIRSRWQACCPAMSHGLSSHLHNAACVRVGQGPSAGSRIAGSIQHQMEGYTRQDHPQ